MEEKNEKGINYATFELKTIIAQAIQKSELPVTNVKYVLLELTNEIVTLEQKQIAKEQEEYQKNLSESITKNDKKTEKSIKNGSK